jgi:hypothetical protein
MHTSFLDSLSQRGVISARSLDAVRAAAAQREPIGAIAFRYGLLSGSDIDDILDEQRRSGRQFGEIAVSRGFLSQQQVDDLLHVQEMRKLSETAEVLVLSGACAFADAVREMAQFLPQVAKRIEAESVVGS